MLYRFPVAALVLGMTVAAEISQAQVPPVAAPVVVQPTPRQSKFEKLVAKTGTLQKRSELLLQIPAGEGIVASVVRLEDLTSHEVALALQIGLTESRSTALISEEEMSDLKDSVQYISQNIAAMNESAEYIRVEYRALSGASIGYMVHFATDTGGEWPATAYVHVPTNPNVPQSGGITRLTIQDLQKIVTDAQEAMAKVQTGNEKK